MSPDPLEAASTRAASIEAIDGTGARDIGDPVVT